MSGYVYILTNESLPGLIKIGRTSRDPFARASELHTTGIPTPFIVIATLLVSNDSAVESELHSLFNAFRVDQRREFFRISSKEAIKTLLEFIDDEIPAISNAKSSKYTNTTDENSIEEALLMLQEGSNFNIPKAERILEKLAKNGSSEASFHLGMTIRKLTRKDDKLFKRMIKYFESAAAENHVEALYELAKYKNFNYMLTYLNKEQDAAKSLIRAGEFLAVYLTSSTRDQSQSPVPAVCETQYYIENASKIHKYYKEKYQTVHSAYYSILIQHFKPYLK